MIQGLHMHDVSGCETDMQPEYEHYGCQGHLTLGQGSATF